MTPRVWHLRSLTGCAGGRVFHLTLPTAPGGSLLPYWAEGPLVGRFPLPDFAHRPTAPFTPASASRLALGEIAPPPLGRPQRSLRSFALKPPVCRLFDLPTGPLFGPRSAGKGPTFLLTPQLHQVLPTLRLPPFAPGPPETLFQLTRPQMPHLLCPGFLTIPTHLPCPGCSPARRTFCPAWLTASPSPVLLSHLHAPGTSVGSHAPSQLQTRSTHKSRDSTCRILHPRPGPSPSLGCQVLGLLGHTLHVCLLLLSVPRLCQSHFLS